MSLEIKHATTDDVPALIDIFFAAFAQDKLLMTCYPDTPANRGFWVHQVQSQMQHGGSKVFKAVIEKDGVEQPIGWAKWLVHRSSDRKDPNTGEERQGALNPDDQPSPDMNIEVCRTLADAQYRMLNEVLGDRAYCWLNAIAVHPSYRRQGAATMLVSAGTAIADEEGLECFSACTTQANENMKSVFAGQGFDIVAREGVIGEYAVHAGHRKAKAEA